MYKKLAAAGASAAAVLALAAPGAWAQTTTPPAPSTTCSTTALKVIEGYVGQDLFAKLRVERTSDGGVQACFRFDNGSDLLDDGGRIRIGLLPAGVKHDIHTDADATKCETEPGNLLRDLPVGGTIAGTPYDLNVYSNGSETWICVVAGAQRHRVIIRGIGVQTNLAVELDQPGLARPTSWVGPSGYPSTVCRMSADRDNLLNATLGAAHVFLQRVGGAQQQVCARVQTPTGNVGGRLVVDPSADVITMPITASEDTAPCTERIVTSELGVTISRTPAGVSPASVCVVARNVGVRVQVNGVSTGDEPVVTWEGDPDSLVLRGSYPLL